MENNNFDLNRFENFKKGIAILFGSYNRKITAQELNFKIEMLMDSLIGLPEHRILEFFKSIPKHFQLLPSDAQIMTYLNQFLAGGGQSIDSKYDTRYGYFCPNGYYIPNGTKVTFLTAHENDLSFRQIELGKLYNRGRITTDLQKEFEDELKKEFQYPRGIVQKHRSSWNQNDYKLAGIEYYHGA